MKCRDCDCCHKGWFPSKPDAYVCIGVKEPFVISDINWECPEYPEKRKEKTTTYDRLIQNLNAVKWDLKEIDYPDLSICIKRINDAIFDAGRLNSELIRLQAIQEMRQKSVDLDIYNC